VGDSEEPLIVDHQIYDLAPCLNPYNSSASRTEFNSEFWLLTPEFYSDKISANGEWGFLTIPHFLLTTPHSALIMSITVTGTIERRDIGMGAWALVTDDGETYEILKGADKSLLKAGQKAKVTGKVRDDIMTTAMIGPALEVKSFEVVNSN
jgi:hypothetical protein